MARRTGAVIMPLLITLAAVYLIWALLVHPDQMKERIIMEVLKTYQMELQAGITESEIKCLLPGQDQDHTSPRPKSPENDSQKQKEGMK